MLTIGPRINNNLSFSNTLYSTCPKYDNLKSDYDSVNFTGLSLKKISPFNFYMEKIFDRFKQISKLRRFELEPELSRKSKFIQLQCGKNTIEALDINPGASKKYVIFFHGVGQNITYNQEFYKSLVNKGYGVLAPEYGGFGNSTGSITSKSIKQATNSAINYIRQKGIEDSNIGVAGFSMGSVPAVNLTEQNKNLKFLVLISPFNSLRNEKELLQKGKLKLPKLVKYVINKFPFILDYVDKTFKTESKIKKIKIPVYFIHSENDKVVPAVSTKKLAQFPANVKNLIFVKTGGHNIESNKLNAFNEFKEI